MFLLMALATLPDTSTWPNPLGSPPATTRESWETAVRPQLRATFEREMYGHYPAKTDITAKVLHEDKTAFGGKATLREVALTCAPNTPPVHWLIVIPNHQKPAGVFVGLNFSGNHTIVADEKVRVPDAWFAAKRRGALRNSQAAAWPIETIIAKGFAVATAYYGEIVPDDAKQIGGLSGALRPAGSDTGAIIAWAWGLARGADYVVTLPGIDPKRVIAIGHSRLGKAALVAAAFDPALTAVVASQAGCGGSAPSRCENPKAETVTRINKNFPHWFCDNFKKFGDDPSKLPFDQHGLVALCAPKPVLFTAATGDQWANPPGQLAVLKAAGPVYALYGYTNAPAAYPAELKRVGGRLAFWVRPGTHAMTGIDWGQYLEWARQE